MDDASPPPLPVSPEPQLSAPLPTLEPTQAEYPFAAVATPAVPQDDIPFANANIPTQFNYTTVGHRPGLATAIGVIAIIVACISGLVSFAGGGEAFAVYMISRVVAQMGNFNFNLPPPTTAAAGNIAVPVDSKPLSVEDSGLVTTVLQDRLALDGPRLQEFTQLLHKHGSAILPVDENSPLTEVNVKDAITESHKAGDGDSSAILITAQGTVEIYPDHATFSSKDGSTIIRTSARDQIDSVNSGAAVAATTEPTSMPGGTLQPETVSRAISQIRQTQGVTVTPAQIAAIRRELSNPSQALIVSGSIQLVYFAANTPNNELQVNFSSGTLTLDAAGNVVSSVSTVNPWGNPRFSVPGKWVAVVVSECAASTLLAIYLFVVGIMSLRGSLHAPRLLRIYAVLKILFSIVAAIGVAILISEISSGSGTTATTSNQGIGLAWGVALFLAGILYPVGVLIALRSAEVRQYFTATNAS